jgi:hypothetical protein
LSRSGQVTVADMFTGDAYKAVIARAVRAGLLTQCGEDNLDARRRLADPDAWGLTAHGLVLSADGWTFGCGRQEVDIDIPWRDLRSLLRPEFATALGLH